MPDYGSGGDITVIMEGPFAGGGGYSDNITRATAYVDNWKGATSPYTQVINLGQISVNTKVDIQMDAAQLEQLSNQRIAFTAENSGGTVTVSAVGDKPAADCTFQITLSEVVNIGTGGDGVIRGNTISTVLKPVPSLPLAGGKMEGNIDMDGNELTNLRTPYKENDATPKDYVDKVAEEKAEEKANTAEKNAKDYAKKYTDDYATTKPVEKLLTASGWSENAPYTQTITVEELTDGLRAFAYPNVPDDAAEAAALAEETAKVSSCKRSGNELTFRCLEDKPDLDIPVIVEVYV